MIKSVYLCGAMEGLTTEEAEGWRNEATAFYSSRGICTLDPCRRKKFHNEPYSENLARRIVQLDRADIAKCDLVLCNLIARGKGKAWGSVMELVIADNYCKPVITLLERDFNHPFIRVYSTEMHSVMEAALTASMGYLQGG